MRYDPNDNQDGTVPPPPDKQPNEFYFAAWRRTFHLFGVASRTEFWSFTLVNLAIFVVLFVVSGWTVPEPNSGDINYLALLLVAFVLVVPVPTLTVAIRRIRDVTGNGWFALLLALTYSPFIGSVIGTLAGRKLHHADESAAVRSYSDVWRDTADWRGRSTRREFWSFVLFNILVFLGMFGALTILAAVAGFPSTLYAPFRGIGPFEVMFAVVIVISSPMLPLAVRRVRDATGSGWVTVPLSLIAFVNPLLFVVILSCPPRDDSQRVGRAGDLWDMWRKTADWSGVAKRNEFWPFTLIAMAILSALGGFALIVYNASSDPYGDLSASGRFLFSLTVLLLVASYVALTIPWFPLMIRRVRDATGSGWWALAWLMPYIGWIIGFVLLVAPSREAQPAVAAWGREENELPNDEVDAFEADDPWSTQNPEAAGQQHSET